MRGAEFAPIERSDWSGGAARRSLQMLATGSLFAGSVHAGLCPAHFQEAPLFGAFFVVVATLQLLWAGLILVRPNARLLVAGAGGNLATIGVWGMSRIVGVPFGPTPWRPEPVGLGDVFVSVVELVVALGVFYLVLGTDLRQVVTDTTRNVRRLLPEGSHLPDEVWAKRHKWIVIVLWLHAPGIFVFSLARGGTLMASLVEASIVVAFALGVGRLRDYRRASTVVTSIGLLTCSALLVRLSSGSTEMHFHYFVMVGVVTLYQDWWPFLVAIGYVVLQHGLAGVIDPSAVYDHQSAINNPWTWASIHGVFILAMSSAGLASWRLNESFLVGVVERQEKLEESQEIARLGGWEHDLVTGVSAWSAELYHVFGLDPELVTPSTALFFELVHPDDLAAVQHGLAATKADGTPFVSDLRVTRADGVRWLHFMARATAFVGGEPSILTGTAQDITERKEAEASLHQALSLLGATLDATADGILVVDFEGKITSFNRRFAELWRLPEDVLASGDDTRALEFVLGQVVDPAGFVARIRELYAMPESDSEDVIEFHDGRTFERFSMPQRVDGKIVGRVWSFHDVSERNRLERELSHQAFHDPLTNLANQALFRDRVDHALVRAARHGQQVAVLFLDLDNFKTVNDSLGHTTGDELIVAVAERLRACLRATDTAARLGGDEFAVLVEDFQDEEDLTATAERMMGALQRSFSPGGRELFISASIGIAFGTASSSSDQLLRNADLAMYTAKRRGKSCFEVYRTEMHATAVDRLEMEADLRRAITMGQMRVEYQPIMTLDGETTVGVEALVRWHHPEKGVMPPEAFIPLAEETGLIREVGRQVLIEACSQTKRWQIEHPHASALSVSVNVSAHQFHHEDLVDHVRFALDASGMSPRCLVLEFTETAMMHDTEATIRKLRELKGLGVRLAIDDFGTGYSSLSYLNRFPVDMLKIDRAFVSGCDPGDDQFSLASAIVSIARVLCLEAVAEGIENEMQARALAALGCNLGQGFHFCRPLPPEKISERLSAGPSSKIKRPVLPV